MQRNLNQSCGKHAGLALIASALLVLTACGGGEGAQTPAAASVPAVSTLPAPPTLQSLSANYSTTVSIGSEQSGGVNETSRISLLDFDGKVTEGPSKDTELSGKLVLKGTSTDQGKTYTLEGKLITSKAAQEQVQMSDAQREQINALVKQFNQDVAKLHDSFREAVSTLTKDTEKQFKELRDQWIKIDPKAADANAQYQALTGQVNTIVDALRKQLEMLSTKLQDDIQALRDKLEADIKAAVPAGTSDSAGNVIPVTGTLSEDGKIALTFDLGSSGKIEGIGSSDAQGKFTGTFTGPQAGDKGSWSATSGMKPQPAPSPTPTGSPMPTPPPIPSPSPSPTAVACTSDQNIVLAAAISEITSPTVFLMAKGMKFGAYQNGFPVDHSGAKFVNGSAADLAVGKRVVVCASGDEFGKEAAPIKAQTVEFVK
jgi:archaellum component FlaC